MLGFVALDRQPGGPAAVWLVSRTDVTEASSTNAVVVDLDEPDALRKVHALTRDRAVIATPGSTWSDLPLPHVYDASWVADFLAATRVHQDAITQAIADYAAGRKGQKLVSPSFPADPGLPDEWPDSPEQRALLLAGVLCQTWTNWLLSDTERLRRTVQPRTGRTPWVMPTELNQPDLLELPPSLADVRLQPVEAYGS